MYKILFDDGKIKMLVATDMDTLEECEEIVKRQEKPECYSIIKIENRREKNEKNRVSRRNIFRINE